MKKQQIESIAGTLMGVGILATLLGSLCGIIPLALGVYIADKVKQEKRA